MQSSFVQAGREAPDPMEEVRELISRYGLDEDLEHVIVPVHDKKGHARRIFLLKRRFMRIMYPEGQYVDYPLADVIEATVKYPELLLSEALYLMHKESDTFAPEKSAEGTEAAEAEGDERARGADHNREER